MAKTKAKATKTTFKKTASTSNTSSNANNAWTNQASSANAAFNFKDFSSFMNPSQFMDSFKNAQNFNPSNAQQFVEKIMQTGQKNIEAMTACTQIAMERAKELMEDQASFANRMLQETTSTIQEAFSNNNNDPKEKMEEIADYAKYFMEKAATHARKTSEENMQTAQKITTALKKRVSESLEEINSAA
jgi:hypothetical protein